MTITSAQLRKLTRSRIQSLAKRNDLRAVGKTEDIIGRLMEKYPGGVPTSEDNDDPSVASALPAEPKTPANESNFSLSSAPDINGCKDKGKGKAIDRDSPLSVSPSDSLWLSYPDDEVEQVAGPSGTVHESENAFLLAASGSGTVPSHREPLTFAGQLSPVAPLDPPYLYLPAHNEETHVRSCSPPVLWAFDFPFEAPNHAATQNDVPPQGGPTRHDVVDILRQCTLLVNELPQLKARIAELDVIERRTKSIFKKIMPEARELTVVREYLERTLLGKLKLKPELWDGTGKLPKAARKLRMDWLRGKRRADAEKECATFNEMVTKAGFAPEPLEKFLNESDEEIIESLLTTPTGSQSASASPPGGKRTREEIDEEADGESGGVASPREASDDHRKKRRRS